MINPDARPDLPLVRLSAINPFLVALAARNLDASSILAEHGLPTRIPASGDLFVSAQCMYRMVEASAELAADRFLGARIGHELDLLSWDPIALAVDEAATVGDLLNRFILNAGSHASSVSYTLEISGRRAAFMSKRAMVPEFDPAQNDAFYLGFMSHILESAAADSWSPYDVRITVSDPDAIPPQYQKMRVFKGDRSGFRLSFPTEWLFERFDKSKFRQRALKCSPDLAPVSTVEALRRAIAPHLHEESLTVSRAAELCGVAKGTLARKLQARGTTIRDEIARLRRERAESALSNSDRAVSRIATDLGFSDPTAFSRAFKNWTGKSPQEYRRTANSHTYHGATP